MKRFPLAVVAAFSICATPAIAQNILITGPGNASCATWTTESRKEANTVGWILGFWTGMNVLNNVNHAVGEKTDGRGVIEEVRLACTRRPSEKLWVAAQDVYLDMWER